MSDYEAKVLMDNFKFDITSEGEVLPAMKIAFSKYRKAVGYRVDSKRGLILYWVKPSHGSPALEMGYVDSPFPLDVEGAAFFASRWLANQDYGPQPDHDGDNSKGWRIYCEGWGMINSEHEAFVAIQPVWAMYGK